MEVKSKDLRHNRALRKVVVPGFVKKALDMEDVAGFKIDLTRYK
jgi:hypothetical protein